MSNNPTADAIAAANKLIQSGVLDLMNLDAMQPGLPQVVKTEQIVAETRGRK